MKPFLRSRYVKIFTTLTRFNVTPLFQGYDIDSLTSSGTVAIFDLNFIKSSSDSIAFTETQLHDVVQIEAKKDSNDKTKTATTNAWDSIINWISEQQFSLCGRKICLLIDDLQILSLLAPNEQMALGLIYDITLNFELNNVSTPRI